MQITQAKEKMSISTMKKYINQNVDEISLDERKMVLKMIIDHSVEDSKIHTKGNGTMISYKDMSKSLIISLYNFIQSKINFKLNELNKFPNA
jgi:hypothetical protein